MPRRIRKAVMAGRWSASVLAIALCATVAGGTGHAAERTLPALSAWEAASFDYVVVDQDLRQVLQEFGRKLGLVIHLSDEVQGQVRNMASAPSAGAFLDTVAAEQNLVWFDDGVVLHVATADEVQTKIVPLGGASFDQLNTALGQLVVTGKRLGLRASATTGLVNITGPTDYVALVEQAIAVTGQAHTGQVRTGEVRIIRGRGGENSS